MFFESLSLLVCLQELQCSDWSCRPLTEDQRSYAAADAQCLLDIFDVFQLKIAEEGILCEYLKISWYLNMYSIMVQFL